MARQINSGTGSDLMGVMALIAQMKQQDRESALRQNQLMMQLEQMKQQTATAMAGLEFQKTKAEQDAMLGKEQLKQKNLQDYTAARNALMTSAGWKDMPEAERKAALDAIDNAYGMKASAQSDKKTTKVYPNGSAFGDVTTHAGNALGMAANTLWPGQPFPVGPNREQDIESEINVMMDEAALRARPDIGQPELWNQMNPQNPQQASMSDFGEIYPREVLLRGLSGNSR